MSNHIDVDFTVLPLGKEPLSKKLQSKKSDTAMVRKENKKLDIDNKQMEWRLHQLKLTMEKEKEDRGKQGYFWQSSKTESMESFSRNILGKTVTTKTSRGKGKSSPSSPKQKPPTKVKVLKDQPLDLPKRKKQSKSLYKKFIENDPQIDELQLKPPVETSSVEEIVNNETWISIAPDRFSDNIMEIQSDSKGNLPIASLQAVEPNAIGLFFIKWGRKRILPAVDRHVIRPKQGWGAETYYPYVPNNMKQNVKEVSEAPSYTLPEEITRKQRKKKTEIVQESENTLLQGKFDEEESAQSFQQALLEWRSNKNKDSTVKENKNEVKQQVQPTSPVEMSVHAVQSDPITYDVKFSETSSLSYMERLLLKKHRSTDVPPLPAFLSPREENDDLDELKLTEDEIEERERIRQLFAPHPTRYCDDNNDGEHVCTVTEIDEVDYSIDEESTCIVEEISDDNENEIYVQRNPSNFDDDCTDAISGRSSSTPSMRSYDVTTPRLSSYPPQVTSPDYDHVQRSPYDQHYQDYNINAKERFGNAADILKIVEITETNGSPTASDKRSISSNEALIESPSPPKSSINKVKNTRNSRSARSLRKANVASPTRNASNGAAQRSIVLQEAGEPDSLLSAVSNLPINPDAHYTKSLAEFFSDGDTSKTPVRATEDTTSIEREIIQASSPHHLIMCNKAGSWKPYSSITFEEDISCESIDASRFNKSESEKPEGNDNDVILDTDEKYQQEEDDAATLNDLEWELASRTGNITEDGRISRLIDEWSDDDEDRELGIINDNWAGSGLSTPEIDHLSLDEDNDMPQWSYQHLDNDFELMENFMINDVTPDDDEQEYISTDDMQNNTD